MYTKLHVTGVLNGIKNATEESQDVERESRLIQLMMRTIFLLTKCANLHQTTNGNAAELEPLEHITDVKNAESIEYIRCLSFHRLQK